MCPIQVTVTLWGLERSDGGAKGTSCLYYESRGMSCYSMIAQIMGCCSSLLHHQHRSLRAAPSAECTKRKWAENWTEVFFSFLIVLEFSQIQNKICFANNMCPWSFLLWCAVVKSCMSTVLKLLMLHTDFIKGLILTYSEPKLLHEYCVLVGNVVNM